MLLRFLPWMLRILYQHTVPACSTECSHIRFQGSLEYSCGLALKCTPNGSRWYTHSLLAYTHWRELWRSSQGHSKYASKFTSKYVLKHFPNYIQWHTPSLFDCILLSWLSRCSQVYTEFTPKYTSEYVPRYSSNCIQWHTPSLLDCILC